MLDQQYTITLDQLSAVLLNENTTHAAARVLIDERRQIMDAMRAADPDTRHRLLLQSSSQHSTGPPPSPGPAPDKPPIKTS